MRFKRKLLSIIMTAAMITTLFAGLTISASATSTEYTGQTTTGDYTISTLAQLNTLASTVNAGTSYSGSTFTLTSGVSVSASSWTPIGDSAHVFAGKFDGGNNTVTWSGTATGSSYWGVFGKSSGIIANVKTAGTLTLTGSGSYVSPLVGYSSGSVYNCVNSTDFSAENMDNVGGVVGAMENSSTTYSPIYLQYCGNTGDITGSKRVGGVVGAVYCSVQGNVVVDQCYCKDCTITTTNSSKVWSGGLAGYVKGKISNSYTDNISLVRGSGRYLSGLVGILNGSNPAASAENCYANVISYSGCETNYDRPFVGSVDSSSAVTLKNCYWTETSSSITQPTTGNWGTWTGGGKIGSGTITWANLSLGSLFNVDTTGTTHPTLTKESDTTFTYDVSTGTAGGSNTNTITFNGGDETALLAAITAAGSSGTIVMNGAATISSAQQIYDGVTFIRGTESGALFNINPGSGNTVRMTSMTIDGNGSGTLFDVVSGTLQLRGNITLQNCATAVNVQSGATVEVNKASITATNYSIYNAGSFILNDFGNTSISGNVYLASGKYITLGAAVPSSGITVQVASPSNNLVIAQSDGIYTITDTDKSRVSSVDEDYAVDRSGNTLILVNA